MIQKSTRKDIIMKMDLNLIIMKIKVDSRRDTSMSIKKDTKTSTAKTLITNMRKSMKRKKERRVDQSMVSVRIKFNSLK